MAQAWSLITDFIQEDLILQMLIDKLNPLRVAKNVVKNDSDVSLGQASTYKVPGIPDFVTTKYDGTAVTPQLVSSTFKGIPMDQFSYCPFQYEKADLHSATWKGLLDGWLQEAAEKIARDQDIDIFSQLQADASTNAPLLGASGTPIGIDDSNVLDYVEELAIQAGENNVMSGSMVLPHFMGVKLAKELGVTTSNEMIAGQGLVNGFIQKLFGFDIFTSNLMPQGTAGGLLAGEYTTLIGKRNTFMSIDGYDHFEQGVTTDHPRRFIQLGHVYGYGFTNTGGWFTGVVNRV